MNKKFFSFFFLTLLVFLIPIALNHNKASAYFNDNASKIGLEYQKNQEGNSSVGVCITLDNKLITYVRNHWIYDSSNGWKFGECYFDDSVLPSSSVTIHDNMVVINSSNSLNACHILGASLKKMLPSQYIIEIKRYQYGKLISQECENSQMAGTNVPLEYSLKNAITNDGTIKVSSFQAEGISYVYNIYSSTVLGKEQDVPANADGGTIIKTGLAYYNGTNYTIMEVPEAYHEKDQWEYEFTGWYTKPQGGEQVISGSQVGKGQTIYAHWNRTKAFYNVDCYDVLGETTTGAALGKSNWSAAYGETVSGKTAGENTTPGAYYEGREYTGCTSNTVSTCGAIVYRHFKNADYQVSCVDVVNEGPETGNHLGISNWMAPYSTVASGGSAGVNTCEGSYYKGYRFESATSKVVGSTGCTVYRYFNPVKYNVNFHPNSNAEGSMDSLTDCYYGHTYTLAKNGYIKKNTVTLDVNAGDATCDTSSVFVYPEFAGWSVTSGGSIKYSDGGQICNLSSKPEDKTLYAVWSTKELTLDASPERLGYRFNGWSRNPSATVGKKQFQIEKDETLYAVWTPAPVKYHVEYYKQKLDKTFELSAQYSFEANTGTEVELDDIKELYPGYMFDEASSTQKGIVKADGSLVLTAYFHRMEYEADFDLNGGVMENGSTEFPTLKGLYEERVTVPDIRPVKDGYEFAGWSYKKGSRDVFCKSGEEYRITNHNQTLYAVWLPKTNTPYYIIPYYQNVTGSGYYAGEAVKLYGTTEQSFLQAIKAQYGSDLQGAVEKMFSKGFWAVTFDELQNTFISGDGCEEASLYLNRKQYQITYTKREAESGCTLATQAAIYGSNYHFPGQLSGIGEIGRYATKSSRETNKYYYPGDNILVEDSMEFIPQYKVSLITPNEKTEDLYCELEESVTISCPERTNYIFQGWYLDEEYTNLYSTGSFSIEKINKNMSFYSKWSKAVVPPSPEVTKTPLQTPSVSPGVKPQVTPSVSPEVTQSPEPTLSTTPEPTTTPVTDDQINLIGTWVNTVDEKDKNSGVSLEQSSLPKKGKKVVKKGLTYKITTSTVAKRTVTVMKSSKKSKKISIPSSIKISGCSYKVTAISSKAFANCKKLKQITIGTNVSKIGDKAFYKCNKLRKVTMKSKKLVQVGKNAWKKVSNACIWKVGNKKTTMHKKLISMCKGK